MFKNRLCISIASIIYNNIEQNNNINNNNKKKEFAEHKISNKFN